MSSTDIVVAWNALLIVLGLASCGSERSTDVVAFDSGDTSAFDSTNTVETGGDGLVADYGEDVVDVELDVDVETADSALGDADVFDCSTPRETCPCEYGVAQPCCLRVSEGLECTRRRLPNGEFVATWQRFNDCGCIESPDCGPSYDLCPIESRGF